MSTRVLAALSAVTMITCVPSLAHAQSPFRDPHTVNFCVAKKGGGYDFAAQQIAMQSRGVLQVQITNTNGSLEILDKLDKGECDAGIVQSDALGVYRSKNSSSQLSLEIGAALYQEPLHLICNAQAGLTKITGLTKDNLVFIGANGSGTSVTWDSFKLADPKRYGVVQTLPLDGERALGKVALGGDNGTCMMYVAGLKSADMMRANAIAGQNKGKLVLVPTADSDLLKLRTPGKNGSPIYTEFTIPGGTYPNLQTGFFSSSVSTVAVTATFVANSSYVDNNSADYEALLRSVNNAMPAIKKHVEPQ